VQLVNRKCLTRLEATNEVQKDNYVLDFSYMKSNMRFQSRIQKSNVK
jgi:hypothetical protein